MILRTPLDGSTLRRHHPTEVIGEVDEELHLDDGSPREVTHTELEKTPPEVAVRDEEGLGGLGISMGVGIRVGDLGEIVRGTERLSVSPGRQLDLEKKPGVERELVTGRDNPPSGLSLAMAALRNGV